MQIDVERIIITAMQRKMSVFITDDTVSITPWAGGETEPEEPKPEPKEEPHIIVKKAPNPKKQGAKKPLDMGKVKALRDAGWPLSEIAAEMGVSPQTIANRLKGEADV